MGSVAVTNLVYLSTEDGTNYAGYFVTSWDWDRFLTGLAIGLAVGAVGYLVVMVRRLFAGPGE
jgi:hypothetical protein